MMPGYGNGMGWGWIFMALSTLIFLALIGIGGWLLVRATSSNTSTGGSRQAAESAREILARRYAQGEIDDQEYQQRLRVLSG